MTGEIVIIANINSSSSDSSRINCTLDGSATVEYGLEKECCERVLDKHIVVKGSLERFRDFIFIDDVVEAWFRAATFDGVGGSTINIGTGVRTTVAQVLETVKGHVVGTTVEVTDPTPGDQNGIYADTARLRSVLQMNEFVGLAEGVRRFSDFVKTA